jgi:hypothetical protein
MVPDHRLRQNHCLTGLLRYPVLPRLPDWDHEAMNGGQFKKKVFGIDLGPTWKKLFGKLSDARVEGEDAD